MSDSFAMSTDKPKVSKPHMSSTTHSVSSIVLKVFKSFGQLTHLYLRYISGRIEKYQFEGKEE